MHVPLSQPEYNLNELSSFMDDDFSNLIIGNQWTQGSYVKLFENNISEYLGIPYVTTCSSGTTALEMVIRSLNLHSHEEIIVPSYTFVSCFGAIINAGARPIIADINTTNFTLDFDDVASKICPLTRAILLVHQYGYPVDTKPWIDLCKSRGILLIEDAACALGSSSNGIPSGTSGYAGIYSFHPRKIVSSGEGGAIVTNYEELDRFCASYRDHGREFGDVRFIGNNFRMSDINAAVGAWCFKEIEEIMDRRNKIALFYRENLSGKGFYIPEVPDGSYWNYQSFPVLLQQHDKKEFLAHMHAKDIRAENGCYPAHWIESVKARTWGFPVNATEAVYKQLVLLPMFSNMHWEQYEKVVEEALRA